MKPGRAGQDDILQEYYALTPLELAVLMLHLQGGSYMPDVGFEDTDRTIEEATQEINRKVHPVPRGLLESMLWSSNLMDELGHFWHPEGLTFDDFVNGILRRDMYRQFKNKQNVYFDRFYNLIRERHSNKAS